MDETKVKHNLTQIQATHHVEMDAVKEALHTLAQGRLSRQSPRCMGDHRLFRVLMTLLPTGA